MTPQLFRNAQQFPRFMSIVLMSQFIGNFSNAHKKFENDYWTISIKELVNKIPSNKNLLNNKELRLTFCGAADNNVKFYLKKIKNWPQGESNPVPRASQSYALPQDNTPLTLD